MIGVLTVIAILAAILLPALLRQMDKIAGQQESASLKSFGEALQQSILRNRYIPASNDWASVVAAELGTDIANVTTNQSRKQPRVFLIDPSLNINGAGLPYTQGIAGREFAGLAASAYSLECGVRCPPSAESRSADDFTNIWNAADGYCAERSGFRELGRQWRRPQGSPCELAATFRSNSSLTSYASTTTNGYSIDSTNFASSSYVAPGTGINRYFIQNSVLTLYRSLGVIDSQQILIRDNSFVYNQDAWRGSIIGGSTIGGWMSPLSRTSFYLRRRTSIRTFPTARTSRQ
jgi:type II secretory pathway pseudopilin PulG